MSGEHAVTASGAPERVRSRTDMPKQVPPPGAPKGTIWVGGVIDKTDVCLGVYGDDLDPGEVTIVLGCEPTSSHRRGDKMKGGINVWRRGAWLFSSAVRQDILEFRVRICDIVEMT
jgi:hypothetical protein